MADNSGGGIHADLWLAEIAFMKENLWNLVSSHERNLYNARNGGT